MVIVEQERVVDAKRRVTLPSSFGVDAGHRVMVLASPTLTVVAAGLDAAREARRLLEESTLRRKLEVLREWEKLLRQAGLLGLAPEEIERRVGRAIRRPRLPS